MYNLEGKNINPEEGRNYVFFLSLLLNKSSTDYAVALSARVNSTNVEALDRSKTLAGLLSTPIGNAAVLQVKISFPYTE